VKRYSSGMYVRLAFAVAAHLQPEILLVDEVLAVGDAEFQRKCLGKMGEVAREGRTVLFVSHNMGMILHLCSRALLFEQGRVALDDNSDTTVSGYLQNMGAYSRSSLDSRTDRRGNGLIRFIRLTLLNNQNEPIPQAVSGQVLKIALDYESCNSSTLRNVHLHISIHGRNNEKLFLLATDLVNQGFEQIGPDGTLICSIPRLPLLPGKYTVNLYSTVGAEIADWIQNAGAIDVVTGDFFGSGRLPSIAQGQLLVSHTWETRRVIPGSHS